MGGWEGVWLGVKMNGLEGDGWMDRGPNYWISMAGRMVGWISGGMGRWMDGCTDEWMGGDG